MALIKCKECGKEISDQATACPNCGCPINTSQNTSISIYADSIELDILIDNELIGTIPKNQTIEFEIKKDCIIQIKSKIKSINYEAKANGKLQKISISFDRVTGDLHINKVEDVSENKSLLYIIITLFIISFSIAIFAHSLIH